MVEVTQTWCLNVFEGSFALNGYKITGYESWRSQIESGQLPVAVYVRIELQYMKDELRCTTQTCTARSSERSLRIGRARAVKFKFDRA